MTHSTAGDLEHFLDLVIGPLPNQGDLFRTQGWGEGGEAPEPPYQRDAQGGEGASRALDTHQEHRWGGGRGLAT